MMRIKVRIVLTLIQIPTSERVEKVTETPLLMLIPICALTVLIVLFGIYPDPLVKFAQHAVQAFLSGGGLV